jgi:hypothetical protein
MLSLTRATVTQPWTVADELMDGAILVVAAQDCDISAPFKTEPFVEALTARWTTNAQDVHTARKGNSARLYLLQEGQGRALLADARRRHYLDKRALPTCTFSPILDERGRSRFASWIAGRYTRPAIANELVEALHKPLVKALADLGQSERASLCIDRLAELRFSASDLAPFSIRFVAMLDEGDELTTEQEAELGGWLEETLVAENDAVAEILLAFRTPESISLSDYLRTIRMQLDQFTPEVEPDAA